jgi:hypothetical protein
MANTKGKVNRSAAELNDPNKAPLSGGTIPADRSHVVSGPQTAANYNKPAPNSRKG